MLVKTVNVSPTYEQAHDALLSRYNEMEIVLDKLGLQMIRTFSDGFSASKTKSGEWLAQWEPASDNKYFDKMNELSMDIGSWVKD